MIFDSTNLFSDQQAITATAASTNVIDLGATDTPQHAANAITRDIGKGRPIDFRIQVTEDFDSGADDGTLTITLQKDTVEGFGSAETVVETVAFAEADLVAGYVIPLQWVPRGANQRYIRLNYTVAGSGNFTAGKVTAGLVFASDERDV